MIKIILLSLLILANLNANQDKESFDTLYETPYERDELLEKYQEFRQSLIMNDKNQDDHEWVIEIFKDGDSEWIGVYIHGDFQYGAKLIFVIDREDCETIHEMFQFYTEANNSNLEKLRNTILPVSWNGKVLGAEVGSIIDMGSGHLIIFNLGGYQIDNHIDFLSNYNSYNIELIDYQNKDVTFTANEYFDIIYNKWMLRGLKNAINNGKKLCAEIN